MNAPNFSISSYLPYRHGNGISLTSVNAHPNQRGRDCNPTSQQTLKYITLTLNVSLSSSQEVFTEMEEKYGEVEEMNVCDNLGDHLVGNVYVKVGVRSESHISYHHCNAMFFFFS